MMIERKGKIICCVIALILSLIGICPENYEEDFSFLSLSENTSAVVYSVDYIEDDMESCTIDMIRTNRSAIIENITKIMKRWQDRMILFFMTAAAIPLYLFYYQSTECREDSQLLLCRSVVVHYIHHKDGKK